MGLFDPTTLKFDVEELSNMKQKISDTAVELREFKVTLLHELETLKTKWETPAGRVFTERVDTNWAQQVDKYITIIEAVVELLEVAESNYKIVEEEAKKVSF